MDVLGIDIGGVIIGGANGNSDTSFFGDNFLSTPEVTGAIAAISGLVTLRFGTRVCLISKCGPRTANKTLEWFKYHDFYDRTGISPDRVHFCRKRAGKRAIAAELGVTHYIDNRLEVLGLLSPVVPKLLLFQPDQNEVSEFAQFLPKVVIAHSWADVTAALLDR